MADFSHPSDPDNPEVNIKNSLQVEGSDNDQLEDRFRGHDMDNLVEEGIPGYESTSETLNSTPDDEEQAQAPTPAPTFKPEP